MFNLLKCLTVENLPVSVLDGHDESAGFHALDVGAVGLHGHVPLCQNLFHVFPCELFGQLVKESEQGVVSASKLQNNRNKRNKGNKFF